MIHAYIFARVAFFLFFYFFLSVFSTSHTLSHTYTPSSLHTPNSSQLEHKHYSHTLSASEEQLILLHNSLQRVYLRAIHTYIHTRTHAEKTFQNNNSEREREREAHTDNVSGLKRVPKPPTRMSAFIILTCCASVVFPLPLRLRLLLVVFEKEEEEEEEEEHRAATRLGVCVAARGTLELN